MNFERYRESITHIKRLADNFSSLTRADLAELNRLNVECLSFNEGIVKSFSALVDEIEEGLTLLLDRLDQIKKDLAKISGPESTLGDVLRLETAWARTSALRDNIRAMLEPPEREPADRGEIDGHTGSSGEMEGSSHNLRNLIDQAQKEAAAAAEKSQAVKSVPAAKPKKEEQENSPFHKKPAEAGKPAPKEQPQKKELKVLSPNHNAAPAPIAVSKNIGEAEKKIMAEITKNIEAIKNSRKK
ncbi:MAG: hypothetical protein K6T66_10495 [Peptococcaceae bacterium]|nr:hypothetical protein [Peptococcaceae bacterium]